MSAQLPLGGLSSATMERLRSVFQKYPQIESVILYGSRAKGNYKPGSDIDLTIKAPGLTLSGRLKIEQEIDDLFLPYKVDLSLFHEIENPDLIEHIERVGICIWPTPITI